MGITPVHNFATKQSTLFTLRAPCVAGYSFQKQKPQLMFQTLITWTLPRRKIFFPRYISCPVDRIYCIYFNISFFFVFLSLPPLSPSLPLPPSHFPPRRTCLWQLHRIGRSSAAFLHTKSEHSPSCMWAGEMRQGRKYWLCVWVYGEASPCRTYKVWGGILWRFSRVPRGACVRESW